ncbi:MAG: hypothetical protein ACTSVZ_00680 [Promethearchaeota archaeon]
MSNILLDTGICTLFHSKPRPDMINNLVKKLSTGKVQAFITKCVVLETAKNLTEIYGKESVDPMIYSTLSRFNIQVLELPNNFYIEAGKLQYSLKKVLSACDTLQLIVAKNLKYTFHTTDEKAIKALRPNFRKQITFNKYIF